MRWTPQGTSMSSGGYWATGWIDTSRNQPEWVSSGTNRTTMMSGGNRLASSSRLLGKNALDLPAAYQSGPDGSVLFTPSISAFQRWIGSGGVSPNPCDFRYASDCPQRVTGAPPATGVPVIVPSVLLVVSEVSLAVHPLSSPLVAGLQMSGPGEPCAEAMPRMVGNASTDIAAPR